MKTASANPVTARGLSPAPPPCLFRSFWIAGFECSCHVNKHGERLDMMAAVQHDRYADEDYRLISSAGIRTARDGARWHLIDRGGRYDFSSWAPMVKAAREQGVQVIWDICHYGWPEDVDIFSPAFIGRFEKFCRALTRYLRETGDEAPFFAPVNEISFFSWGACRKLMYPYARGRDGELKRQLVRAVIAGAEAIWDVDRRARLVFPEPLIHIVPPRGKPPDAARAKHESQYEAWDMIAGRCCPELGGSPRYLDIIGVNFYAANQWEVPGGKKLLWVDKPLDSRWRPLHLLLEDVYRRYEKPVFVAETSHYGSGRGIWIREIAREVHKARRRGVPLEGVCIYPILDRFDWNNPRHWHHAGLFDLARSNNGHYPRVLNGEYAKALAASQRLVERGWQREETKRARLRTLAG